MIMKINGKAVWIFRFATMKSAKSFINRPEAARGMAIVLGDNDQFWVATNRDAGRLVKAGYCLA